MSRIFIAIVLLLASISSVFAKPNFVVIVTDDQDDAGSLAYMPKLHNLIAKEGVTFKNSFVNFPICAPSRASFLTGQSVHTHGVAHNNTGWTTFRKYESNDLPVWLQQAGYSTALVGKYINGYGKDKKKNKGRTLWTELMTRWTGAEDLKGEVPPGWTLWYAAVKESYYDHTINENGKLLTFGNAPSDYQTDVLQTRAVRFLKDQAKSTQPFFMLIATKAPHGQGGGGVKGPAIASPGHSHDLMEVKLESQPSSGSQAENPFERDRGNNPKWKRGGEDAYRAALQSLQSVDDLLEAVVNELASENKLENTIIIYTSDNGFIYGARARQGKNSPYEGAIRVPLLMRGPGIPKDATRDQLVNNLDVVATIVALSGAKPGVTLDGRSLVPLFENANAPWRSAILVELDSAGGVRTANRKYVNSEKGHRNFEALYDLSSDPQELDNKANDPAFADDLVALRRTYQGLKSCAGTTCWVP